MPIKPRQTGGSSTFARKFKQGMQARGHQVYFEHPGNYDVLLVVASCSLKYLIDAKARRKKIVHRLDGVYYPMSVAGRRWRRANIPLQIIHHFFSDYTIFQSKFSRYSVEKFLGQNRFIPSQIIYNGVDTQLFKPKGECARLRDNKNQHIFITTGRFRRDDQLEPILKAFEIYRQKYEANAKLYIIGNRQPKGQKVAASNGPVINIGPVPNHKLPMYLRAADVFLFSHLNPPCPNNVLEAMASGRPVCGVADGAMHELTRQGKNSELVPSTPDNFSVPRQLDLTKFASNMHRIMQNQAKYSQQSRAHAAWNFSLAHMLDQYENTLVSQS